MELRVAIVTSMRMVEGCAPECVISARSTLRAGWLCDFQGSSSVAIFTTLEIAIKERQRHTQRMLSVTKYTDAVHRIARHKPCFGLGFWQWHGVSKRQAHNISGLSTTSAWAVGRLGSEASSRRWRCSWSYWNMRRWIHITFIIIHALRILQGYLQQLQVIFNDTLHPPHTI
jgi:hypothetical protein